MTVPSRPAPVVDPDSRPYWRAARDGVLVLQRCDSCARFQFYGRLLCRSCSSTALTWQPVSGRGTVYSFSVMHRAADPYFEVPYVVALVDLAEGPRVATNLVDVNPDEVVVGMPVRVTFEVLDEEVSVPLFRPDESW
jgi:uncharacterized OB-fold protein